MREFNIEEIADENIDEIAEERHASGTSQLRSNFDRISRKLNKTLLTEADMQNYADFTEELKKLNDISNYFYNPTEDGYPKVDKVSMEALKTSYMKVLKSCDVVINNNSNEGISLHMKGIAKELKGYLQEDLAALEVCLIKDDEEFTLDKIIELGRTNAVSVGDQQLGSVGGMMSQRIPISVQGPSGKREGFFTKTVNLDVMNNMRKVYDKYRNNYPELKDFIDTLENADQLKVDMAIHDTIYDAFMSGGDRLGIDNEDLDGLIEQLNEQDIKDATIAGLEMFLENVVPKKVFDSAKTNPSFIKMFRDISKELRPVLQDYKCYLTCDGNTKWLGLSDGANVDKRNAAMSALSGLISDKNNIAKSEPMIVIINGVPTSGTFMEKAEKWDADDRNPENPILTADADVYDNYRVFDDIADLQVKDFIAGNLDRHEGNIRMRFAKVDGKTKLVGITGIDNDMSFGLYVPKKGQNDRVGNIFVTPEKMGVIGEETALKVLSITKETLFATLKGYSLSKEELEAAWSRTEILQKAINDGIKHYEKIPHGQIDRGFLRMVPSDKWDKYSLETLSAFENQFTTLTNMHHTVTDKRTSEIIEKRKTDNSRKITNFLYNEQPQPEVQKPPFVFAEAVPVGNGLITIDPNVDRLGVNNPDNVRIVIKPEQALGTVGNYSSGRVPISYKNLSGQDVPGYFTFASTVNAKNQIRKYVDDTINELDKKNAHPEWKGIILATYNYIKQDMAGFGMSYNINNYDLTKIGLKKVDADQLSANEEFNQFYTTFLTNAYQTYNKISFSYGADGIEADKNGRIDTRNVQVSKVSALLGAEHVVAKATTMQIQVGGKIHDGVFMEEAPGVNIENIKPGTPEASLTSAAFDNTMVLRDIADLQIIGFICQNVDMHENNFLCTFSDGEPKKATSIKAIDNDYSFGAKKIDPDDRMLNDIPLNNINVISEGMAYRIVHMDPKALDNTLSGQGLSQKEIDAAKERFYQIFDKIKDGSIRVIKDNEWETYKLADLAGAKKKGQNIDTTNFFNVVKDAYDVSLPQHLQDYQNLTEEDIQKAENNRNKAKADQVEDFSEEAKNALENEQFEENITIEINDALAQKIRSQKPGVVRDDRYIINLLRTSVDSMVSTLHSASSVFYGGNQFRDLRVSADGLKQQVRILERKVNQGEAITKEELNNILDRLNIVTDNSNIYMQYKADDLESRGLSPDSPGRVPAKRIGAAVSTRNTADALYYNIKNTIMVRDIVANPETEVYERITKHQTEASALGTQPVNVEENLASIIYFNTVLNHIKKYKNENKVLNALYKSELDKNVKEITSSDAFKAMIQNTPREELLASARDMNGQKLFREYVKHMAIEKKNVPDGAQKRKTKEEIISENMNNMKTALVTDLNKIITGIGNTYGAGKSDKKPSENMSDVIKFMKMLNKKNLDKLTPEEFSDALDVLESKADNYLETHKNPKKMDRIDRNTEILKIKWTVADYRNELKNIWAGKGGRIHNFMVGPETKGSHISAADVKKNLVAFGIEMAEMSSLGFGSLVRFDPEFYDRYGDHVNDEQPALPSRDEVRVFEAMKDWFRLSIPGENNAVRPVSYDIIKEKIENLNKATSMYLAKNHPGSSLYEFIKTTGDVARDALKNIQHIEPLANLEIDGERVGVKDILSLAKSLDAPYKNMVAISSESQIDKFGEEANNAWYNVKDELQGEENLMQVKYYNGKKLRERLLTSMAAATNNYSEPPEAGITVQAMNNRIEKLSKIAANELFVYFADEAGAWQDLSRAPFKDNILDHVEDEFSKKLINDAAIKNIIKTSTSINVTNNIIESIKKLGKMDDLRNKVGIDALVKELKAPKAVAGPKVHM